MSLIGGRIAVLMIVSSALGCALPYKPPTRDQPHAVLKLRRTYQISGGTHMREGLSIDGHDAFGAQDARSAASTVRTDAILVHPRTAEMRVAAGFFHTEMRPVQESYTVQIPYSTFESYNCGTSGSYQMCSRTVTRYRSETRYRTVIRAVEVSDGSCATAAWLSPALNGSYLLEYEYAHDGLCRLACFEQVPGATPGQFDSRRCELPSAASIRKAKKAR